MTSIPTPSILLMPLLAILPLVGGCGVFSLFARPNPANNQLRRDKDALETQVADLKSRLAATERVVQGLRNASSTGTTQPTLPAERLARLVTTHGLKFGRLTGGADTDRNAPGDEALRVYVVPTDQADEPIKAAGAFTIEAFDLDEPGAPLLGSWTVGVEEARQNWRGTLLDYTYAFSFPWQRPPTREQVTVKVRFADELTQTPFAIQKVVKVRPPAANAATRPATARATARAESE